MFSAIRLRLALFILILAVMLSTTPIITAQEPNPDGPLVSFNVSYGGRTYDSSTNQTTFTYIVSGTGQRPDLSHFDLGIPICSPPLIVVGTSPTDAVRFGVDPTTGVDGIKWDLPLKTTETRTYSITFNGNVSEGTVQVAVKGDTFQVGSITGPSCAVASIDVDKFVSTDGASWQGTDAPGPEVEVGAPVSFRFVVTNIGNAELSNLTLTDSMFDTSACPVPPTLAPGASFECIVGPFPAVEGQHTNTGTASGDSDGQIVTDSDVAHYFSGDLPLVEVEKFVSTDGGTTWKDSAEVEAGENVSFKFVVTNTGNVELTNFTLADSAFDTSSCALPPALGPGVSFECTIGPFPAGETEHTNTVTASATFEAQTVTDTDTASYGPPDEDDDSDVIIIIEGPVEAININIITIFGIDIEVDPDDPALVLLEIGDTVRIEGDMLGTGDTIIIVAVTVIVIDIDILIFQPGTPPAIPLVVPPNCKITGIGNNNPHLKCSSKGSKKS
jgi:hypothetical protein